MNTSRKGEFAVHCIRCGKNFYADTTPTCGGMINGQPMCRTDDIKRAMNERIKKEKRNEHSDRRRNQESA